MNLPQQVMLSYIHSMAALPVMQIAYLPGCYQCSTFGMIRRITSPSQANMPHFVMVRTARQRSDPKEVSAWHQYQNYACGFPCCA